MRRPLPRALRGTSETSAPANRPSPRPRPRPRPAPAEEPVVESTPAETPGGSPRLPFAGASTRLVAVLAAVAVVLAGVVAYLGFAASRDARTATAAREAVAAARVAAQTLFSYDHRTIDADIAAAEKVVTGQLAKDYQDTSKTIKPLAVENRAVVEAEVSEAGVVSAEPGRVVVLLYVNQSTQNKNVSGTRLDMSRVRATMVEVGGDWRMSRAEPL